MTSLQTNLKDLRQPETLRAIAGSALVWAWFDALFMGALLPGVNETPTSETCALIVYASNALVSALPFVASGRARALLERRGALHAIGACGTVGTLLLVAYALTRATAPLVVGAVLGGAFMGASMIAWGAVFCHRGARTATPIVAGSMAAAVVLDVPLLLMAPLATALFFAAFPIASMAVLANLPAEARTYRPAANRGIAPQRNPASYIRTYFGVSVALFAAIALVMAGFGFVQHLSSFSSAAGPLGSSGVFIQLVRGGVAVVQFLLVALLAWHIGAVYRSGLLIMIGGFMLMPLALSPESFVVSAAVIVGGYTVFDLIKWCAFSQIAHSQSQDPLKTIALLRLVSSLCYIVGDTAGIALVGTDCRPDSALAGVTNIVGYLVVIATVLLLSSEDIWGLFSAARGPVEEADAQASTEETDEAAGFGRRLGAALEAFGLTEREREVATLLVRGRTQPWIAEFLGISESTVGTHVRHIYQKAGVHTRQEFLDALAL